MLVEKQLYNGLPDLMTQVAEEELAKLPDYITQCTIIYVPQVTMVTSLVCCDYTTHTAPLPTSHPHTSPLPTSHPTLLPLPHQLGFLLSIPRAANMLEEKDFVLPGLEFVVSFILAI